MMMQRKKLEIRRSVQELHCSVIYTILIGKLKSKKNYSQEKIYFWIKINELGTAWINNEIINNVRR